MATYVSNRDSGGKTDEKGHFKFWSQSFIGNVLSGQQVIQNTSPNMSILVTEGDIRIPVSSIYAEMAWSEGNTSVSIPTADPSNPRIDRLIAYLDRNMTFTSTDVNNPGMLKYKSVNGTPNAAPSKASDAAVQSSVGSINPWVEIATIRVNAAVTQILSANITDTRSFINLSTNVSANHITPVGSIIDFGGSTAPTGWLLCYGQPISRTIYSLLFSTIGITYGTGDGATTFNLPDCRGRSTAGKDNMGGTSANRMTGLSGGIDGSSLSAVGGEEAHVLTVTEIASHQHSNRWQIWFPSGTGSLALNDRGGDGLMVTDNAGGGTGEFASGNPPASNASGGGGSHNNIQPTIIFNKIIKY